jgi:hypothetical protein
MMAAYDSGEGFGGLECPAGREMANCQGQHEEAVLFVDKAEEVERMSPEQ